MPRKDYSLDITPANAQRRPEHVQDETWIHVSEEWFEI